MTHNCKEPAISDIEVYPNVGLTCIYHIAAYYSAT